MKKLLLLLALLATPVLAADSYVFVQNGRTITNGAPVNVKALRASQHGSYFWFTLDGKTYIARDAKALARIEPVYEPLFTPGNDIDEVNRKIERKLHEIAVQLVRHGVAARLLQSSAHGSK